jgi:hypothetical protein
MADTGITTSRVLGWVNPFDGGQAEAIKNNPSFKTVAKQAAKTYIPGVAAADWVKDSLQSGGSPNYTGMGSLTQGAYTGETGGNTDQNTTTTSTGGGGWQDYDSASVAESLGIINSANQGLSRLAGQRTTGQANILSGYNSQYNDVNTRYGRDKTDYTNTKQQTQNDQISAKNQINAGVRSKANSLQRLLGAYGAGSSDAAERYAPYLAARQGSQQRQEVNDKFSRNLSALDTNWTRADEDYKGVFADLIKQRDTQFRDYDAQTLQQEAQLRGQIAQAQAAKRYAETGDRAAAQAIINAAQPTINNIYTQIDRLAAQTPVYQQADVEYDAPDLAQYTYDDNNYLEAAQTPSGVSPYFWGYFNQDDKEQPVGY